MRNKAWDSRSYSHHGRDIQPLKIPGDILRFERDKQQRHGHPAVFPTALPAHAIAAYTNTGQSVYDPFCGSGTSILAAEQTGRVAYGMEIHAPYVQIAVNRYVASAQQTKMAL